MTEDQIFRVWIMSGVGSFFLLFVGALTNKITVYRDYQDLGWSLSMVLTPFIGFFTVNFIVGTGVDSWIFATETLTGQVILTSTLLVMGLSAFVTYKLSIHDNGLLVGLFVGTAKVIIAVIITIFSIGLLSYLFREKRKLGHIAIFYMFFGVFAWFVKVLINGGKRNIA